MEIITRRGTDLPLDSRRKDALATYARFAAEDDGVPTQAWVRKTWGLKDYEAKDLLRANASEAIWERIAKSGHPEHGGWRIILAVYGAVIGHGVEEFLQAERRKHVELARRNGALVRDLRAGLSSGSLSAGEHGSGIDSRRRTGGR